MRLPGRDTISVTAPLRASMFEIEEFVKKHSEWVFNERERLGQCKTLREHFLENPYIWHGETRLKVSVVESRSKPFWIEDASGGEIAFEAKDDADLKKLFLRYARESIGRTLDSLAASKGFGARTYSVRDQRSRWASRSSTGMLSFNWRVALLEQKHQEYVILHELAHEKFMDHSVSFWIHLSRLCENAKRLDKEISKQASEIFMVER
jgi:predicted metal-dependent hydrolase